jgi:hypothetical protein
VIKNSQKQDREERPGKVENPQCVLLHGRIVFIGIADARTGDGDGRKRKPVCPEGRERYTMAKKLLSVNCQKQRGRP